MTATEWFNGANKQAYRISLKPPGMDNCKYNFVSHKCTFMKKGSIYFPFTVSDNQGQGVVTVPVAAKQPTIPFSVSSQPFTRLGWNPDVKAKQDEVQ